MLFFLPVPARYGPSRSSPLQTLSPINLFVIVLVARLVSWDATCRVHSFPSVSVTPLFLSLSLSGCPLYKTISGRVIFRCDVCESGYLRARWKGLMTMQKRYNKKASPPISSSRGRQRLEVFQHCPLHCPPFSSSPSVWWAVTVRNRQLSLIGGLKYLPRRPILRFRYLPAFFLSSSRKFHVWSLTVDWPTYRLSWFLLLTG